MAGINPIAPLTLASATSGISALTGLLVASPQTTVGYQVQLMDGSASSAPPIIFNYEGEQTATLESDITDHFIEDNTAVQDQIAIKPVMITTQGFVGELNDVAPLGLQTVQQIANKLTLISAYTPGLSATALIAYNEAFFAYQAIANAASAAIAAVSSLGDSIFSPAGLTVIGGEGGLFNKQPNQNKQQTYFQLFYGYQSTRTLFTVQTPWAVFTNMAIKTLRAVQDETTNVITDFEVTFKQMRFVETETVSQSSLQGRLSSAVSASIPVPLGTTVPPSNASLASKLA